MFLLGSPSQYLNVLPPFVPILFPKMLILVPPLPIEGDLKFQQYFTFEFRIYVFHAARCKQI